VWLFLKYAVTAAFYVGLIAAYEILGSLLTDGTIMNPIY
jgi:hypothetical protein